MLRVANNFKTMRKQCFEVIIMFYNGDLGDLQDNGRNTATRPPDFQFFEPSQIEKK